MNEWMAIGLMCGGAVGIVVAVILMRMTKTDGSSKCRFDERQELIRGRGFKYAFFTVIIYEALYAGADAAFTEKKVDTITGVVFGIMLGVGVYAVYCIWHEGYFALNENPKRVLIAFTVIAAANFLIAAANIIDGVMVENGMLTFRSMNLFCGILFLVIGAALFFRKRRNAGEGQ